MKTIKTIAFVAALGLAPAVGLAADAPEVVAEDAKVEYVAGMTGVT